MQRATNGIMAHLVGKANRQQKPKPKTGADWKFAGWIGLVRDAQMDWVGLTFLSEIQSHDQQDERRRKEFKSFRRYSYASQMHWFRRINPTATNLLRLCCDEWLENAKQNAIPS
jgi:hypothetical protein